MVVLRRLCGWVKLVGDVTLLVVDGGEKVVAPYVDVFYLFLINNINVCFYFTELAEHNIGKNNYYYNGSHRAF